MTAKKEIWITVFQRQATVPTRTMCQFQVLEETVLRKKQLWKANSVKVNLALEYIYLLNKIG